MAALWWFFNSRADWDKTNTLASEVVEEYGPNERLVYIKGACWLALVQRLMGMDRPSIQNAPIFSTQPKHPPLPLTQAPPSP